MKKIIAIVISFALVFALIPGLALADGQITVMLNGEQIEFNGVAPIMINNRTMLPFRAVLEAMGASVDYDMETTTVSASRGDTSISFNVNGDVIMVNNENGQHEIIMDAAPVMIDDSTYVPVRFIANALNISVGWDSYSQQVLLLDYNYYFDKIAEAAPAFGKFMDMPLSAMGNSASKSNISFKLDFVSLEGAINVEVSAQSLSEAAEGVTRAAITMDSALIQATGDAMLPSGLNISEIFKSFEGSSLEMISTTDTIYIKSDMFGKLAAVDSSLAVLSILDSQWVKLDVNALLEMALNMPLTLQGAAGAMSMLSADTSQMTMRQLFISMYSAMPVNSLNYMTMDVLVDTYSMMFSDQYFTLTEEDGVQRITIKIDTQAFLDLVMAITIAQFEQFGSDVTAENLNTVREELEKTIEVFEIDVADTIGGQSGADRHARIQYKINMGDAQVDFNLNVEYEPAELPGDIQVPSTSLDVIEFIQSLYGVQ